MPGGGRHYGLEASSWYMRLAVEGARARGLPDAYAAQLQSLSVREDPD